jgi:hypothetical protein
VPYFPFDATGKPLVLIMEEGVARKHYAAKMKACESAWRATGDPWAVAEAHTLTIIFRRVSPKWLDTAVWTLAEKSRGNASVKRADTTKRQVLRYYAVRDAHSSGLSWAKAYDWAADALAGTAAAGEPDTMHKAYNAVARDIKEGRAARYYVPQKLKSSS